MLGLLQAPKKAKKRVEGANSNVFSMFEQAQIQEFKEVGGFGGGPWRDVTFSSFLGALK